MCGQKPNANDTFTDKLSAIVTRLKQNPQRRHEYMTWEQEINIRVKEARAEALKEGITEGQTEKAIETAKNFLRKNISAETVAECTGLPLEEVLKLQK